MSKIGDIVIADDVCLFVRLKKGGKQFIIPPSAVIKAAIVSVDRETVIMAEVTQPESNDRSDWPSSLVSVVFSEAQTSVITVTGQALLEIQVNDGKKTTWFVEIKIGKGIIS